MVTCLTFLTGHGAGGPWHGCMDMWGVSMFGLVQALERAVEAVRRRELISFVGLQEEFDVSVQLLLRMRKVSQVAVSAFAPDSYSSAKATLTAAVATTVIAPIASVSPVAHQEGKEGEVAVHAGAGGGAPIPGVVGTAPRERSLDSGGSLSAQRKAMASNQTLMQQLRELNPFDLQLYAAGTVNDYLTVLY